MGLIDYIRNQMPEAWDKAAREMEMKTELIHRIHDNVPRIYKNRYHYKEGMRYIQGVFRTKSCSIVHLIDATGLDGISLIRWSDLNLKIREYEHQCE